MKSVYLVSVFLLVGGMSLSGEKSDGGPTGEGCVSCHGMNVDVGLGGASLAFPEAGWVPGAEYDIVVGTEDSADATGMELGASAGQLLQTQTTRLESRSGVIWSVSRNRQMTQWNSRWRAPLEGDTVWFPFSTVQSIAGEDWTWTGRAYWKRMSPVSVQQTIGTELLEWRAGTAYWRRQGTLRITNLLGVVLYERTVQAGEPVSFPDGLTGLLFLQMGSCRTRAIIK